MIHWDYIKGLNDTGNSYSFIKFPVTTRIDGEEKIVLIQPSEEFYKNAPTIYTTGGTNNAYVAESTTNGVITTYNKVDFGAILTSYDYIELTKKYHNNLNFYLQSSTAIGNDTTSEHYFQIVNKFITDNNSSEDPKPIITTYPFKLNLRNNNINIIGDFTITGRNGDTTNTIKLTSATGNINTTGNIAISENKIQLTNDGNMIAANKCEALYFNATSDKRAKENFTYVPREAALSWINNLSIYTFNYRDSGSSSIGITTQQVQDKPINNFNFVENLEATGENGDYMTIKESKLVYMCMSAIQELSQQNKLLQEKLVTLEDELKNLRK